MSAIKNALMYKMESLFGSDFIFSVNGMIALLDDHLNFLDETARTKALLKTLEETVMERLPHDSPYTYTKLSDRSDLRIGEERERVVGGIVHNLYVAVEQALGLQFPQDSHQNQQLIDSFIINGLDVTLFFEMFDAFLDGRTPEEVREENALVEFSKLLLDRWDKTDSTTVAGCENVVSVQHGMSLGAHNVSLTIANVAVPNFWGEEVSNGAKMNFKLLEDYLKIVLNDNITAGNEPIPLKTLTSSYAPDKALGSIIKGLRVYKNRNMKITFNDNEGFMKFMEPIMKLHNLTSIQ